MVAWALSLAAALAMAAVLVQLYRLSSDDQSGLSAAVLEQGCAGITENYGYFVAGWAGPRHGGELDGFRRDLQGVVGLALSGRRLEAGIWQGGEAGQGAMVGEPADDIRAALIAAVATTLREVDEVPFAAAVGRQGLACPLGGPVPGMVAWVAERTGPPQGARELRLGIAVLVALVLLSAAWLSVVLLAWQRRLRGIEAALANHEALANRQALANHEHVAEDAALPLLPMTGERELDRIVTALNAAGARLAAARERAAALAAQVAAGKRLAALGRVAAGVAHEIRNPIAAMRLRAENALAGDPARRGVALEAILGQVARLDRLSGELLSMTQRRVPEPAPVAVDALLHDCVTEQPAGAVRLEVVAPVLCAMLDAALLRRVLDNLVENARQHTPAGGTVTLSASVAGDVLRIGVADTGPGVAPELRAWLFEPFVTGRSDSTGLGLAIARQLAEAMGGRLFLGESASGARFVLEVPWRAC